MKKVKVYLTSMILVVTIVFVIIMSNSLKTSANEKRNSSDRLYSSILIENGDSLWSIAQEFKPDDVSVKEYVQSLKEINGLKSDNIHSGNHLMIYYYED